MASQEKDAKDSKTQDKPASVDDPEMMPVLLDLYLQGDDWSSNNPLATCELYQFYVSRWFHREVKTQSSASAKHSLLGIPSIPNCTTLQQCMATLSECEAESKEMSWAERLDVYFAVLLHPRLYHLPREQIGYWWSRLALQYESHGDVAEAHKSWFMATSVTRQADAELLAQRAKFYMRENALELWNKALVKKPFVSTWILERARVYRELQQFDTAKKELESLKEQVLKPIEVLLHDIAEERSHVQHLIDTSSSSSTASVKS